MDRSVDQLASDYGAAVHAAMKAGISAEPEAHDDWNDELLDLFRVLTISDDQRPEQDALLERICDGPLIPADDLPVPALEEHNLPATIRGGAAGHEPDALDI